MTDIGYLYILHKKEFIDEKLPIYKIGRTIDMNRREKQYTEGSCLIKSTKISNHSRTESKLISIFKRKFTHEKTYGREYFSGNLSDMIVEFDNLCNSILSDMCTVAEIGFTCNFCNSKFTTKRAMDTHQKSALFCIKKRDEEEIACKHCNIMVLKKNSSEHIVVCADKKINNLLLLLQTEKDHNKQLQNIIQEKETHTVHPEKTDEKYLQDIFCRMEEKLKIHTDTILGCIRDTRSIIIDMSNKDS